MDRLKNLWWKKGEDDVGSGVTTTTIASTGSGESESFLEGKNGAFPGHGTAKEEEEENGSLSTSGMTDSFTSGIENVVSSSRRASQSELSFQTASLESSQSDSSFQAESLQSNQSDCDSSLALSQSDFAAFTSRRTSRSDVSFSHLDGSRRSSQSDFTSAAASRKSSKSEFSFSGACATVKGAADQSRAGVKKYGVTSFDPYKRFDLQFVTFNEDLTNFYVKV